MGIFEEEVTKFSIIFSVKQSNRFKKKLLNIEKKIEFIESNVTMKMIDMFKSRKKHLIQNVMYELRKENMKT